MGGKRRRATDGGYCVGGVVRFGGGKVDVLPDGVGKATVGSVCVGAPREVQRSAGARTSGEHFGRRDVVEVMVELLLGGDRRRLRTKGWCGAFGPVPRLGAACPPLRRTTSPR